MTRPVDYAKEYDNSGRVANADQLIDNYVIDASLFREADDRVADYDIEYAPRPRNKMDIFWPKTDEGKARKSPLVMFIHGGYWQGLDKSSFSHLARGLNLNGIAVAMPSYTLCPDTKIEGIITELRCACLVLYQSHKKKFAVAGHSAGGHLAACMMATDWEDLHSGLPYDLVTSGMGISGLYDLLPLLETPVNDAVQMDEAQARRASPLKWVPEGSQRFQAWVGGDESNEYHRQSRELATHWSLMGTPTDFVSIPGKNHFTIVDGLTDPESEMTKALIDLAENPQRPTELQEPEELDEEPEAVQMETVAEARQSNASASKNKPKAKPAEPESKKEQESPKPTMTAKTEQPDGSSTQKKTVAKPVEPAPKKEPETPKPTVTAEKAKPAAENTENPKSEPKKAAAMAKQLAPSTEKIKSEAMPANPAPKKAPKTPKPKEPAQKVKPAAKNAENPKPESKEATAKIEQPNGSTSKEPAERTNAEKTKAAPKEKS